MIQDLLKSISPIFEEDICEYEEIKKEIMHLPCQIIWYASSGLDIYPIVALATNKISDSFLTQIKDAILVMSDYCPIHIATLKDVYKRLDNGPVKILWKSQYGFSGLKTFVCNIDGGYSFNNGEVYIDQMIPFKLWGDDERKKFKSVYKYHPYMTNHPVPDKDWHIVYFLLRLTSDLGELVFPMVFIGAENLLIFENIFTKYDIPIEAFFAVRVAGKSGSWDYTHDFNRGELPNAIKKARINLRPRYWGLEKSKWGNAIPETFKEISRINGLGFGGCTIFKTNWRE